MIFIIFIVVYIVCILLCVIVNKIAYKRGIANIVPIFWVIPLVNTISLFALIIAVLVSLII